MPSLDDGQWIAERELGGRALVVVVREVVEGGGGEEVVVEEGGGEEGVGEAGGDADEGAEGGAEVLEAGGEGGGGHLWGVGIVLGCLRGYQSRRFDFFFWIKALPERCDCRLGFTDI